MYKVSSSTCIPEKLSLKTSLNMDEALLSSTNTFDGCGALCSFLHITVHLFSKFCKSLSNSATFLPSATVRMITPNPFGLMLFTSLFKRSFSSLLSIFCETDTRSEKGTITKYRPAMDNSELILGPLVEMGSFTI